MIEQNLFLRPLDKVLYTPPCSGQEFLIDGSENPQSTSSERVYLYEVKKYTSTDILFGSFLQTESDDLGEFCFTRYQVKGFVEQNLRWFSDISNTHFFLLKERGGFHSMKIQREKRGFRHDFSSLRDPLSLKEETRACVVYIPAFAIG